MAVITKQLRVAPQTVTTWLDRLDRLTQPSGQTNLRISDRYSYRPTAVTISIPASDEETVQHVIAARNISREGFGGIAGQFIYPQSKCTVKLTSPFGRTHDVSGRVARCRYLVGSGSLHEVGVEFDRPIDLVLFAPQSRRINTLLIADPGHIPDLFPRLTRPLNVATETHTDIVRGLRAATAGEYDLIVIDLDSQAYDGFTIVQRLRDAGWIGPIIGLSVQTGRNLEKACTEAGCTGYLAKPLTRASVHNLITSLIDAPVVSTLADDPDIAPLIDRFVADLRDRVAEMALALDNEDYTLLEDMARKLRAEAGSYGFDVITETAAYLQALVAAWDDHDRIRHAVRQLMHLCLKARPATSPQDTPSPKPSPEEKWRRLLSDAPHRRNPVPDPTRSRRRR